jgi:hypothetical protein
VRPGAFEQIRLERRPARRLPPMETDMDLMTAEYLLDAVYAAEMTAASEARRSSARAEADDQMVASTDFLHG